MTNPEQSSSHSVETEPDTPELYGYKTVLEALYNHNVPSDDIAFIGDVVERWGETIPSWATIADAQQLIAGLDESAERAKLLFEQGERLLAVDHWDHAAQVIADGNAILQHRAGQFYTNDNEVGELVAIEGIALSNDHASVSASGPAQLYVIGGEKQLVEHATALKLFVDISQLDALEQRAIRHYVAAVDITPF